MNGEFLAKGWNILKKLNRDRDETDHAKEVREDLTRKLNEAEGKLSYMLRELEIVDKTAACTHPANRQWFPLDLIAVEGGHGSRRSTNRVWQPDQKPSTIRTWPSHVPHKVKHFRYWVGRKRNQVGNIARPVPKPAHLIWKPAQVVPRVARPLPNPAQPALKAESSLF